MLVTKKMLLQKLDAIRAIQLYAKAAADAVIEGRGSNAKLVAEIVEKDGYVEAEVAEEA